MKSNYPILITENLTTGYQKKNKKILLHSHLNLSFSKGLLISLIGANGIGKSTLLKTLSGIQKPLDGKIFIQEKNLHILSPKQISKLLGLVLTDKLPPSNLSVFELVALGRQPYSNWLGKLTDEDHSIIHHALAVTETESIQNKKHFEISDGQLQKVLIARAIAQDTPLIILDEPTQHLDLHHKIGVFKLLKFIATHTQKCVIMATHDLDFALRFSDEMMVMTPQTLFHDQPKNLISQGVFNAIFDDPEIIFDPNKKRFLYEDR